MIRGDSAQKFARRKTTFRNNKSRDGSAVALEAKGIRHARKKLGGSKSGIADFHEESNVIGIKRSGAGRFPGFYRDTDANCFEQFNTHQSASTPLE